MKIFFFKGEVTGDGQPMKSVNFVLFAQNNQPTVGVELISNLYNIINLFIEHVKELSMSQM